MKPTIDEILTSPEFHAYDEAQVDYQHAWRSGQPKDINVSTDHLLYAYDNLARRCQYYVHLTDECRRRTLANARTKIAA